MGKIKLPVSCSYRQIEEALISLLSRCCSCCQTQQIQGQVFTHGLHQSSYLSPKITAKFFRCKKRESVVFARRVFDQMHYPNVVFWNVMFKGYTEAGLHKETLLLFNQMMTTRRDDSLLVIPNAYTFTFVLKSSAFSMSLRDSEQVHCFTVKTGWFHCNHFVGTMLIDVYSSSIEKAYKVFEDMPLRNVVSWTAMIRAYIAYADMKFARCIFDQMADRDVILWNTMIAGYVESGHVAEARELFSQMPHCDRDTMCWNTILHAYTNANENLVEECERFFYEEMPNEKKNIFSWNVLIGVYSRHGRFTHVLNAFGQMLRIIEPNDATLATVLSACSKLGSLFIGRSIHSYATKRCYKLLMSSCVGNGLIDMYAKCGCIEDAISVFYSMDEGTRDVITWNSMIGGLAAHGNGIEALELFENMKDLGECRPDGITFVGVLSACVHSIGLVERGIAYFKSMFDEYLIDPWVEHYGCMVDLLGRARMIDEALGLVRRMSMPVKPDCVIWSTLLGACQQKLDAHVYDHNHAHEDKIMIIAELAMSRLVRLEPEDVTHYVMLANVYGACKRWADVARLKRVVNRMCNFQSKLPGWSWVQLDSRSQSQVVDFRSSDTRHSRTPEIYETLQGLTNLSMLVDSQNLLS